MSNRHVRIVVLNFNGAPFVYRCIEALTQLDYPAEHREIVVVDNASTDGSVAVLRERFPEISLIEKPVNTGFPANNVAMADLGGVDYVALVNNDAFVEPSWLNELVTAAEADPSVGAWCPKIVLEPRFVDLDLEADGVHVAGDPRQLGVRVSGVRVNGDERYGQAAFGDGFWGAEAGDDRHPRFQWSSSSGCLGIPLLADETDGEVELRLTAVGPSQVRVAGRELAVSVEPAWYAVGKVGGQTHDIVNNIGSRLVDGGFGGDRGFLARDDGRFDEPRDVFSWCGGGVLLRSDYLLDVGLFDERFFLYYEDTDLAWRGIARGWRHRTVPSARMRHIHSASSEEGSPMFQHFVERNRLVMLTKNAPAWLLRDAVVGYVRALASYTIRDIVRPVLERRRPDPGLPVRRAKSLFAWMKMLPVLVGDRRRLRARQSVPTSVITGWSEPQ